jgi:hypothetical protein
MRTRFWWENPVEGYILEDLGVEARIILKRTLEKYVTFNLNGYVKF